MEFIDFLKKLKTETNGGLIESLMDGYRVIFESYELWEDLQSVDNDTPVDNEEFTSTDIPESSKYKGMKLIYEYEDREFYIWKIYQKGNAYVIKKDKNIWLFDSLRDDFTQDGNTVDKHSILAEFPSPVLSKLLLLNPTSDCLLNTLEAGMELGTSGSEYSPKAIITLIKYGKDPSAFIPYLGYQHKEQIKSYYPELENLDVKDKQFNAKMVSVIRQK